MLTYDMSSRGEESRYIYLYRCIRTDIENGVIKPEEKLPSKRGLSQHLGVSLITVENAYAQLIAEGYVAARQRQGYYAQKTTKLATPPKRHADAGESVPAQKKAPLVADLTGSTTAKGLFPYNLWAKALRHALSDESEQSLKAELDPQGSFRLRQALANYLRGARGLDIDPSQIVVGAGAQTLYGLIVSLLGRQRVYALEDPGYRRLTDIYSSQDVRIAHVGLDGFGVQMQELRNNNASVMHIMPSHQYPTGLVTPISRRYELLGWAAETPGRYLIEDDYDCEFRLAGRPIPPLQSIDAQGSVIYMNTFTRTLGSALRLGYMVLPPKLAAEYRKRLGFYSNSVSVIDQLTLARFIESGEYERHVNRCRSHYRKVRDSLVEQLKSSSLGPRIAFLHEDEGLHFVMKISSLLSEKALMEAALKEGVAIKGISSFKANPQEDRSKEKTFVLNFYGLELESIPQTVSALEAAWEE